MATLTHDAPVGRVTSGIGLALVSAGSFGMSGSLARGLMDLGWTAGAATLARVGIAAIVLVVPGMLALRGRWSLLRRGAGTILAYGMFAVVGAQLCYFMAVSTLDVSVALLIEYLSPVAVVAWLWVRHGHRPARATFLGAAIAAVGLVLLLDVLGGGPLSTTGVAWALGAMVGAAVYFVISGDDRTGLPPITLAAGGLVVAFVGLIVAAALGVLPVTFVAGDVRFVPFDAPVWTVLLALGVITAGVAYVAGIAATRRLGARLASFVGLLEVVAATLLAWFLLGQAPGATQFAGAALVLLGVIVVKLGEKDDVAVADAPVLTVPPTMPPTVEPPTVVAA
ncbi:EamA family transporter [Demequina capsici]|uniref:DMT family transporter n=1 Tax=Demequina capsici TaxID=3075620 RepID=A0AA96FAE7_9MICO|nr:DMT family transporter [Demequina sp. OYTSA14]WNM25106.1 DMT family transporter [Demequina sp. OYTSA14]